MGVLCHQPDRLHVLTRSTVVEILFEGTSEDGNLVATGVRFLTDGHCREGEWGGMHQLLVGVAQRGSSQMAPCY